MNKRKVGAKYEEIACTYLEKQGYKILERNLTTPHGEIDIIAQKERELVFCECKFRSSQKYGDPLEAVDRKKQRHISKSAAYYYTYHGYGDEVACRFDVIAIYEDGSMEHAEDAFDWIG